MTPPFSADEIRIEELEIFARVGVPDEERATPQRLTVSLGLQPRIGFADLQDDISRAVNYVAVCEEVRMFVREHADRLIETMADAMAAHLGARFALSRVELELRKFVLPETKYVAARVVREFPSAR